EARRRAPDSPVRSMSPEALVLLTQAPWPGNVRELASVIERAVVFGADEVVRPDGLASLAAAAPARPWSFSSQTPSTLRDMNREYTAWVLAQTGGNKEQAAQILGVDLSTLYRWQRARHE
ncbi:MAG TPA: helix-turn-helix domain-containing protein, partial [Polyangiaceae bacterium]|nr:helix-turn-helix domain-containing protein [Polyangiaceae bacterium]